MTRTAVRRLVLIVLHTIIGVGGVAAGFSLTVEPSGADIGLKLSYLDGSPFGSYLIPGLVLLLLIGPANLLSAVAHLTRHRLAALASLLTGLILLGWIGVQWAVIGYQDATQIGWTASFILVTWLAAEELGNDASDGDGSASGRHLAR